jgi:hypothetical protein
MLQVGLGAGSSALRRGEMRYRLVERCRDGGYMIEEFTAPCDQEALDRALDVAEGGSIQLWCGERLILG